MHFSVAIYQCNPYLWVNDNTTPEFPLRKLFIELRLILKSELRISGSILFFSAYILRV